jgi:CheY-like chemotaxis protein
MRRPKVLAAHDDPRIVADLTDVFTSLGHTHDRACSQQGARQRLETKKYSYLVLDLDIPARLKGGASHSQNGLNLLEQVRSDPELKHLPIIVLVGTRSDPALSADDVLEWAMLAMRSGATHVVMKPLTGKRRLLDKVIKKALAGRLPTQTREAAPLPVPAKPSRPSPFQGGNLVIYPDRVELCGVVVLTDQGAGLMRQILLVLKAKQDGTIHETLSVKKLAARIDRDSDVAKAILQFRDTVTREMLKEQNVQCGRMAVIESGRHGYRFAKGISARLAKGDDEPPEARREPPNEPRSHEPHEPPGEPPLNDRQKWIVAEYAAGRRPSRREIEKANRCSRATAARDVKLLKRLGLIPRLGGQVVPQ